MRMARSLPHRSLEWPSTAWCDARAGLTKCAGASEDDLGCAGVTEDDLGGAGDSEVDLVLTDALAAAVGSARVCWPVVCRAKQLLTGWREG